MEMHDKRNALWHGDLLMCVQDHPERGAVRLARALAARGVLVSRAAVQRYLDRLRLGSRREREAFQARCRARDAESDAEASARRREIEAIVIRHVLGPSPLERRWRTSAAAGIEIP